MNKQSMRKALLVIGAVATIMAIGAPQIKEVLKVLGVGAVVKQFGPEINKQINKIANHKDTAVTKTKVVPILTVGINADEAIGAAQVMGPASLVDKVQAVAQIEAQIFGREVRIKALIPVESKDVIKNIKRVDGVGVSGIVDLKL